MYSLKSAVLLYTFLALASDTNAFQPQPYQQELLNNSSEEEAFVPPRNETDEELYRDEIQMVTATTTKIEVNLDFNNSIDYQTLNYTKNLNEEKAINNIQEEGDSIRMINTTTNIETNNTAGEQYFHDIADLNEKESDLLGNINSTGKINVNTGWGFNNYIGNSNFYNETNFNGTEVVESEKDSTTSNIKSKENVNISANIKPITGYNNSINKQELSNTTNLYHKELEKIEKENYTIESKSTENILLENANISMNIKPDTDTNKHMYNTSNLDDEELFKNKNEEDKEESKSYDNILLENPNISTNIKPDTGFNNDTYKQYFYNETNLNDKESFKNKKEEGKEKSKSYENDSLKNSNILINIEPDLGFLNVYKQYLNNTTNLEAKSSIKNENNLFKNDLLENSNISTKIKSDVGINNTINKQNVYNITTLKEEELIKNDHEEDEIEIKSLKDLMENLNITTGENDVNFNITIGTPVNYKTSNVPELINKEEIKSKSLYGNLAENINLATKILTDMGFNNTIDKFNFYNSSNFYMAGLMNNLTYMGKDKEEPNTVYDDSSKNRNITIIEMDVEFNNTIRLPIFYKLINTQDKKLVNKEDETKAINRDLVENVNLSTKMEPVNVLNKNSITVHSRLNSTGLEDSVSKNITLTEKDVQIKLNVESGQNSIRMKRNATSDVIQGSSLNQNKKLKFFIPINKLNNSSTNNSLSNTTNDKGQYNLNENDQRNVYVKNQKESIRQKTNENISTITGDVRRGDMEESEEEEQTKGMTYTEVNSTTINEMCDVIETTTVKIVRIDRLLPRSTKKPSLFHRLFGWAKTLGREDEYDA